MAARLVKAVLAGGRVFLAGTAREGDAARLIPAGDWWSDFEGAEQADEESGERGEVESGEDAGEPEAEQAASPNASWTNAQIEQYAQDNDIDLGGATVKADMLDAIHGDN